MIEDRWKVFIQNPMDRMVVQIFVVRKRGDRIEYLTVGNGGIPLLTVVGAHDKILPFAELSNDFRHEWILEAFAEALSEHGVKTESDTRIKATLDAQRYHLEDLRQMLKLESRSPEATRIG